jgi:L-threonylcarbamoyladenylate synthase
MKIVRLEENSVERALARAEEILRAGGVVVVPTDTVYGLLADATNAAAVRKLFAIKKRPEEKAFPIFVRDIATARWYAYISDAKARFLEKVWPGAVTAVFHHKEKLPPILTGGLGTLGIRVPDHPFLMRLLRDLDFPLAQTSANISAKPPAKNIEEIKQYFDHRETQPDLVVDAGDIKGQSSTVVDLTREKPLILRSGFLTKEKLDRLI